jgi:hypothetical protein
LLAEARPYSFIIPEPYLAVNNDDENEWNLIDEKLNDTDDDDDAVQKRIVLFILSICKVVSLVYLFIYIYIYLSRFGG